MALKPHTTSAVTFLIGVFDWIHNKIQPHILCLLRHFIPQIGTILVNKYESHIWEEHCTILWLIIYP